MITELKQAQLKRGQGITKSKQQWDKVIQNGFFPSFIFLSSCCVPSCLLQPCFYLKQQKSAAVCPSVLLRRCHPNGIACVNSKLTAPPHPWAGTCTQKHAVMVVHIFNHLTLREVVFAFCFNLVFKKYTATCWTGKTNKFSADCVDLCTPSMCHKTVNQTSVWNYDL